MAATLWTLTALVAGLILAAYFPGLLAKAMAYLPGQSEHFLDAEETDALNAATALPDARSSEPVENIPEKYLDFAKNKPPETYVQFAIVKDDLVFRIPRTEARTAAQMVMLPVYFIIAMRGLLPVLFALLALDYVFFAGIQRQLTLLQTDQRSWSIISMLSAILSVLLLYDIYITKRILNMLLAGFGNQYILALRDRLIICKTLSFLRHTQMCDPSLIREWTPPLAPGNAAGQEEVRAYFGKITLIIPTENDGRWICAGLSVRYSMGLPG